MSTTEEQIRCTDQYIVSALSAYVEVHGKFKSEGFMTGLAIPVANAAWIERENMLNTLASSGIHVDEMQKKFFDSMLAGAIKGILLLREQRMSPEVIAGRAIKITGAALAERDRNIGILNGAEIEVSIANVAKTYGEAPKQLNRSTDSGTVQRIVAQRFAGDTGATPPVNPTNQDPNRPRVGRIAEKIARMSNCPACGKDKYDVPNEHCAHLHHPPHGTYEAPTTVIEPELVQP